MKVKAAKNFPLSPNGIDVVQVGAGDIVDVDDEATVAGMVAAGQIEDPEGNDYAAKLERAMTTKDNSGSGDDGDGDGDDIGSMTKDGLEAYARERFKVELDKRKTKADLLAEVQALVSGAEADV